MDLRRAQQVSGQSARIYPGDGDDLRWDFKRRAARRCDRLSAHVVRQSGAAAEGCGKCAGRRRASQKIAAIAKYRLRRPGNIARPFAYGSCGVWPRKFDRYAVGARRTRLAVNRKTDIISRDCIVGRYIVRRSNCMNFSRRSVLRATAAQFAAPALGAIGVGSLAGQASAQAHDLAAWAVVVRRHEISRRLQAF